MSQPPTPQRPPGSYPPPPGRPQYGPPPQGQYPGAFPGQQPPPQGRSAPPQGPPPGYGPPPYGPPAAPPPKKSSAGKIILIVLVVLLVLIGVGGYFVYRAVSGVVNTAVGGTSTTCSAASTDDVDAVLGGRWTVFQLGGALGDITAPVLDTRVLPDATTTCWATQEQDGKLARIARYQGADAAARFAAEKQKAKGGSVDQGNGVSLETDGYLGKDVQAGDGAFCTTGDPLGSAGALERRGDTLFYVSTTAAGNGANAAPNITAGPDGQIRFATDDANCQLAVTLIDKLH